MKIVQKVVLITTIMLTLMVTVCFASGNTNIKDLLDDESINVFNEKNEVIDACNNSTNTVRELLKSSLGVEVNSLNTQDIVKAYRFNATDIVLEYNKEKKLEKLICNNSSWLLPVVDNDSKVISIAQIDKGIKVDDFNKLQLNSIDEATKKELAKEVKKNEDKWSLTKVGNSISEDTIKFLLDKNKIEKFLLDNRINNPSKIKFLIGAYFYTNILYIKDGNQEYGIPFDSRIDSSLLKNGQLYTIPQIMDAFVNQANMSKNDTNTFGSAGVSTDMNNSDNSPIIIFSLIIILLFVIKLYSRKVSIKKQ